MDNPFKDATKDFMKFLYEAPEDDGSPPAMEDETTMDGGPPEMSDSTDMDAPPDMGDEGFDDFSTDGDDMGGETPEEEQNPLANLELDEKISAILNKQLYQRYLNLLNKVTNQISMVKNYTDILHTISSDSINIIDPLTQLEENINLWIQNNFMQENYSKNLLFFNKCINLLKLLNDQFDAEIHKGIKNM